jgi:hypothetical protein
MNEMMMVMMAIHIIVARSVRGRDGEYIDIEISSDKVVGRRVARRVCECVCVCVCDSMSLVTHISNDMWIRSKVQDIL